VFASAGPGPGREFVARPRPVRIRQAADAAAGLISRPPGTRGPWWIYHASTCESLSIWQRTTSSNHAGLSRCRSIRGGGPASQAYVKLKDKLTQGLADQSMARFDSHRTRGVIQSLANRFALATRRLLGGRGRHPFHQTLGAIVAVLPVAERTAPVKPGDCADQLSVNQILKELLSG